MKMKTGIKKVLSAMVASVMLLSMVACSTTADEPTSATPTAIQGTGNPGEGATKIGVILVGTRDDYGYNQGFYNFSQELIDELGVTVMVKESVPEDSSAQAVIEQMVAQGCTIIYATSYGHLEYAEEVAKNNPEVAFYTTNPTGQGLDNVSSIIINTWDAAYVNGVAAGMMTETNEIGYIGSFQIPTVISSMNAFTLGAQTVNPDVNVHAVFTGSWSDVGLQTNAINGMASQNIDTVAQFQDYTKTIVEKCEADGIYTVGYHVDTADLAPNTYISGTVDLFAFQTDIIRDTIAGNFTSGIIRGGYAEGMIGNSEGADFVPSDVKDKVNEVIAQMQSGELTAFTGPIYNQDGEIVVAEGETLEDSELDVMDYFVQGVKGSTK